MSDYSIKKEYRSNSYLKSNEVRTSEAFWTEENITFSRFSQYPVYAEAYRIAKEKGITLLYSEGKLDNPRSLKACEKIGFHAELLPEKNRFRVTMNPQQS